MKRLPTVSALLLFALALFPVACGRSGDDGAAEVDVGGEGPAADAIVVYSGRNKSLIGPILERFEEAGGVATEVRYGGTAELVATLLEEGAATPCDVFIGQDAAALGALSDAGMLRPLPADLRARVTAPAFVSPRGDWVGLSGRARVVVYNPERIREGDLPKSLEEVGDPRYRGRFGLAPTNASFQAHMAVYHAVHGREALRELLAALVANEPQRYEKNSPIVEATLRGEIDFGLTNHYYLWRALAEEPEAPGRNFTMPDPTSAFLNLAGGAVLSDEPAAVELLRYLLDDEAQRYFAEETFEYPLARDVAPVVELAPLETARLGGQLDFARVAEVLAPTLDEIAASGLLQQ